MKKNSITGFIVRTPENIDEYTADLREYCVKNEIPYIKFFADRKFKDFRLMSIIPEYISEEDVIKAGRSYEIERVEIREDKIGRIRGYESELFIVAEKDLDRFCEVNEIDKERLLIEKSFFEFRLLYKHEGQALVTALSPNKEVKFIDSEVRNFFSKANVNYRLMKQHLVFKGWEILNIERYDDVLQRKLHRTSDELTEYYRICKRENVELPKFETKYGRFYEQYSPRYY